VIGPILYTTLDLVSTTGNVLSDLLLRITRKWIWLMERCIVSDNGGAIEALPIAIVLGLEAFACSPRTDSQFAEMRALVEK